MLKNAAKSGFFAFYSRPHQVCGLIQFPYGSPNHMLGNSVNTLFPSFFFYTENRVCPLLVRYCDFVADILVLSCAILRKKAERYQKGKGSVLCMLAVDSREKLCDLLLGVDRLLLDLTFRYSHFPARIVRYQIHSDSVAEHVRDKAEIVPYGLWSEELACTLVCTVL